MNIDIDNIKENILKRDITLSKKIYNIINNMSIVLETEEDKKNRILKTIDYFETNKIVGNRGLNLKSKEFTLSELKKINEKNILNYKENEIEGLIVEFNPKNIANYIIFKSSQKKDEESKENEIFKYIRKINRYNNKTGEEIIRHIKDNLEQNIGVNEKILKKISEFKYESIEDAINNANEFDYSKKNDRFLIRKDIEKIVNILKISQKDGNYEEDLINAKLELKKHIYKSFIYMQLNKIEDEGINNFQLNEMDILNYNKDPIEIYDFIEEKTHKFKSKGKNILSKEIKKISENIEDKYIESIVLKLFEENSEVVNSIKAKRNIGKI